MERVTSSREEVAPERYLPRRNRSHHAYRLQPPDGVRVRGRMRWPLNLGRSPSRVTRVIASGTRIATLTARSGTLDATADTRSALAKIALYR